MLFSEIIIIYCKNHITTYMSVWQKVQFLNIVVCGVYEGWNFNSGNYLFKTDTK